MDGHPLACPACMAALEQVHRNNLNLLERLFEAEEGLHFWQDKQILATWTEVECTIQYALSCLTHDRSNQEKTQIELQNAHTSRSEADERMKHFEESVVETKRLLTESDSEVIKAFTQRMNCTHLMLVVMYNNMPSMG